MNKKTYHTGELVFAKVRGYPPWPARIEPKAPAVKKIAKNKYNVLFFGTYETAVLDVKKIFPYKQYKKKFGTQKKMKNFNTALREIEDNPTVTHISLKNESKLSHSPEMSKAKKNTPNRRNKGSYSRPSSISNLTAASDMHSGVTTDCLHDFKINDRVWIKGIQPGDIKFIGMTKFAAGAWIGVQLYEKIGTNDGSVNGVKYFKCQPMRGIFVRPEKLTRTRKQSIRSLCENATPCETKTDSGEAGSIDDYEFQERTEWSKMKIKELLIGAKSDTDFGKFEITDVIKCEGKADRVYKEPFLIFRYKFYIQMKWKGALINSKTEFQGFAEVPHLYYKHKIEDIDVNIFADSTHPVAEIVTERIRPSSIDMIKTKLSQYHTSYKEEFSQFLRFYPPIESDESDWGPEKIEAMCKTSSMQQVVKMLILGQPKQLFKKKSLKAMERDYIRYKLNKKNTCIQKHLLLLIHAKLICHCKEKNVKSCTTKDCDIMQLVLLHMESCDAGKNCNFPQCATTRRLVNHWKFCSLPFCDACVPIRRAFKNKEQMVACDNCNHCDHVTPKCHKVKKSCGLCGKSDHYTQEQTILELKCSLCGKCRWYVRDCPEVIGEERIYENSGHVSRDCPEAGNSMEVDDSLSHRFNECNLCGVFGHIAQDCKSKF